MKIIAFDTETFPIGPGAVLPKLVCASFAHRGEDGKVVTHLLGNGDAELLPAFHEIFDTEDMAIVGHNVAYDLGVICSAYPELFSKVFAALEAGRITDTKIREKLINLSTIGDLESRMLPDGSAQKIKYSLADLVEGYLGKDRSGDKKGPNSWRVQYHLLNGYKASDYPPDAYRYAIEDATDTLAIFELQQERVVEIGGVCSTETETLHTAADFCLLLSTAYGVAVDQEDREIIEARLTEANSEIHYKTLIDLGILTPGKEGGWKSSTIELRKLILSVCEANGIPVQKTDTGQVKVAAEVLESLDGLHPAIDELLHKAEISKLISTEMPRLRASRIHANYNALVSTGRTSSYGSKEGKSLFPSINIQNVDPRVRPLIIPDPGWIFLGADYSMIELVAFGWKTKQLFGESVHYDLIQKGVNLHTYLGGRLAYELDAGFQDRMLLGSDTVTGEGLYLEFARVKKESPEFFKRYRTLAKPTGLGFPGGMGTATFIHAAKKQYGIDIDEELAQKLKDIWLDTYPEAKKYFAWVNQFCSDPCNPGYFRYTSPCGMVRSGTSYCETCNGAGLQSATAEGAKHAIMEVSRACYDPSMESILYGCRMMAFVHDEIILQIPDDEYKTARAQELSKLMIHGMSRVLDGMKIETSPVLMHRWFKEAEPVWTADGKLMAWEPKIPFP